MSAFWRQAGLSYVQFSAICAQVVRNSLQASARAASEKNAITNMKYVKWEGGKPVKTSSSSKA